MTDPNDRFYVDGRDVRDRQRPGLIAGFGSAFDRGTSALEAAALLNSGDVQIDYYEWWEESRHGEQ